MCFTKNKNMFTLFKITDNKIFKQLGNVAYIRNGVGYGFISTPELYHNSHLEIGFGRTTSGYGDWGGGFDRASTSPLKIVIDKNYNIISTKTDSFTMSKNPKNGKNCQKIQTRLGKKLIVKNELLKECIDTIFGVIPVKSHIGLDININDVEQTIRMLNHFCQDTSKYDIEDAQPTTI